MATKKKIEIYSAGCSTCKETIELVKRVAGSSHEVVIHDMQKSEVASKAKQQAVVIDGKLARLLRRSRAG
jgi:glutaredoxin 3